MRAISIFFILSIFLITGCASVEVVKEATKASKIIETSIKNLLKPQDKTVLKEENKKKILVEEQIIFENNEEKKQKILVEKQIISKEQKNVNAVVMKQKKIANIDLLKKNMQELNQIIGQPRLIRKDRNTITARFDSKNCRLFIFMDSTIKTPLVEYYELRSIIGELIDNEKNIKTCFNEILIG